MDDDEYEATECAPVRFDKTALLLVPVMLVQGAADTVHECCVFVGGLLGSHLSWKQDQERFAREAALSIETIIAGGERG